MADISGIWKIPPSYPVKPAQPANRDEERKKDEPPQREPEKERRRDDDEPGHIIDEHV
ncbi:MAG: hypothetical protein QNI99_18990 [Woeseiaceae bacterium]|nr:hypothetical protein [Woeseiaceae bacterium]